MLITVEGVETTVLIVLNCSQPDIRCDLVSNCKLPFGNALNDQINVPSLKLNKYCYIHFKTLT